MWSGHWSMCRFATNRTRVNPTKIRLNRLFSHLGLGLAQATRWGPFPRWEGALLGAYPYSPNLPKVYVLNITGMYFTFGNFGVLCCFLCLYVCLSVLSFVPLYATGGFLVFYGSYVAWNKPDLVCYLLGGCSDATQPLQCCPQGRGGGPKASTSWASEAARAKAESDCATLWVCFAYMPKP